MQVIYDIIRKIQRATMFRKRNLFIFVPIFIIIFVTYLRYREIPFEEYQNKTLLEMQSHNDILERISKSYIKRNNIDTNYLKLFYDCVGEKIYLQNKDNLFETVLNECKNDYDSKAQHSYHNISWLMKDFNKYDGSYSPLQKIIQKTIKDPKTYEMLKTSYELRLEDERPHMFVSIDFKALNLYGMLLTRNMSARVDAKTKEIYDLK